MKTSIEGRLQHDLILQQVGSIRKQQKRLGTRKLIFMMQDFMEEHHIEIGRDKMFDLLASRGLLIRKRKSRIPHTTYSDHWMRKYPNLIREFIPAKGEVQGKSGTFYAPGIGSSVMYHYIRD